MIKITNISKTFSGNQVLENISLDIEEGDVVALIGDLLLLGHWLLGWFGA